MAGASVTKSAEMGAGESGESEFNSIFTFTDETHHKCIASKTMGRMDKSVIFHHIHSSYTRTNVAQHQKDRTCHGEHFSAAVGSTCALNYVYSDVICCLQHDNDPFKSQWFYTHTHTYRYIDMCVCVDIYVCVCMYIHTYQGMSFEITHPFRWVLNPKTGCNVFVTNVGGWVLKC